MEDKRNVSHKTISSSMVDLKAELHRKQVESEKERQSHGYGMAITGRKWQKPVRQKDRYDAGKNRSVAERARTDELELTSTEQQQLEMAREKLEKKSKLYSELSQAGENLQDSEGNSVYMVDFEKKFVDEALETRNRRLAAEQASRQESACQENEHLHSDSLASPDQQWVDYTDELGRSRRCMHKDLPTGSEATTNQDQHLLANQTPDLLSSDMRREIQRQRWEEEERRTLETQDTIHYANIRFNENREHGVGFYQFSREEEERQQELARLKALHEETIANQATEEKLRDRRRALIKGRLEKVRQRRLAQGKSVPERSQESGEEDAPPLIEQAAPITTAEPLMKRLKVREWDLGKQGSMRQPATWNDPRESRDEEFAPPSFYYDQSQPTNMRIPGETSKSKPSNAMIPRETNQSQSSAIKISRETLQAQTRTLLEINHKIPTTKHSQALPGTLSGTLPGLTSETASGAQPLSEAVDVASIPLPLSSSEIAANIDYMLKALRH